MIVTKCSCGFSVETGTAEEGYKITHQHFLDNINTHVISTIVGRQHVSVPKEYWVKRLLKSFKSNNEKHK